VNAERGLNAGGCGCLSVLDWSFLSLKGKGRKDRKDSVTPKEAAIDIIRTLTNAGHRALLAGGCVRDALMGREPKDFDVATDAPPGVVEKLFRGAQTVGAHFGVVVVRREEHTIEVATFRKDGAYLDGRHPESVEFSSPEEDAQRRDFTVNGLFEDPIKGEIIDYVGGQTDMQAKVLRAIGDAEARFNEDQLRLMRAVRFATVLGFEIEAKTWSAMCELAPKIRSVSIERLREEFTRTMLHPNRVRGFDLLVESGLMGYLLPEILVLKGCEQPPQFHPEGDVFVHTRLMLSLLPEQVSPSLVLSVLFHDIAKPATQTVDETGRIRFNSHEYVGARMTESILKRMKYSNDVIELTVAAVENHMAFKDVPQMRTATLKRFMARSGFDDELELHRVDCMGSHRHLDNYEFVQQKREEFANAPLIPQRLITGHDLMQLGWKAGKEIGRALHAVQTLQLEGTLTTKEEALAWVQANGRTTSEEL
jgi:poly(A) polymerase